MRQLPCEGGASGALSSSTPLGVVYVSPPSTQVSLNGSHSFTYDHVFAPSSTQEELFEQCVQPLIEGCFNGYNATILAYGQTVSRLLWLARE